VFLDSCAQFLKNNAAQKSTLDENNQIAKLLLYKPSEISKIRF
jgi:hypothetical protein